LRVHSDKAGARTSKRGKKIGHCFVLTAF